MYHSVNTLLETCTAREAFCLRAVCACVRDHNQVLKFVLINRSREFHQICNFGAVGHKDELTRFWRSRSQPDHICSNKHFRGHFLTYLRNAWTYFHEALAQYSFPDPHDIDDFSKSMVQRSRSRTKFSESALFRRRQTDRQFAIIRRPSVVITVISL